MFEDQKSSGLEEPVQAGQYYLMEKIAQGGMAEIFKGLSYDASGIGKTVCIKKILPQIAASKEFIDSLIDEAKISVTLSHGNIAQVYDLGKVGDDYFMVMEYVDGRTLSQISRRCAQKDTLVPVPLACYFMAEVLNGLNYIHFRTDESGRQLGIVHRDISPQNIMVSFSGTVKIIDFGIAKARIKTGNTDTGILKGKFAYMSPEQARGDPIDHRSDVFSLGVIFHELLTGKRLFKGEDNRETLRNVRKAKAEPPSSSRPEIPPELDEIVLRSLKKERRERYPFASEMHDELVKFLYTTYPDFKPSDAAEYVSDLFRDELPKSGAEEEARTPYLIIDHTDSALVDRNQFEETKVTEAPIDMSKFAIGEMQHGEHEETTPPAQISIPEEEPAPAEEPSAVPAEEKRSFFRRWRIPLGIAAAAVLSAALIVLWHVVTKTTAPSETESAKTAKLLVTTDPSDAQVFLDDELMGSGSPVTISDIDASKPHLLLVKKDGFVAQSKRVKAKPGEFKDFSISLKRATAPASTITISSTPPGAKIFLDDAQTNLATPATLTNVIPEKQHTLGLFLENYKYWTTGFATREGETQNFHVQMAVDYGSLSITTQPENALVLIDDSPAGQTPLLRENLEPGKTHRIEVWVEGYLPYTQEIRIAPGKLEELHLTLTPSPHVPLPGTPQAPAVPQEANPAPPPEPAKPALPPPEPMGPAVP